MVCCDSVNSPKPQNTSTLRSTNNTIPTVHFIFSRKLQELQSLPDTAASCSDGPTKFDRRRLGERGAASVVKKRGYLQTTQRKQTEQQLRRSTATRAAAESSASSVLLRLWRKFYIRPPEAFLQNKTIKITSNIFFFRINYLFVDLLYC